MRQLPWFRLYSEARTDAKLRSLPDDQFRVWFNLLCYAADQDDGRGTIDISDSFIVALEVAGGDEELLSRTCHALSRLRIVEWDEVTLTFINFVRRQYDKPSDTPEQTRERKRKQRATTRDSTSKPPQSRDVTPSHAQEKRRVEKSREEKLGEESPNTPLRARAKSPAGFAEFWGHYPKKVGRQDAEKAWAKLDPPPEMQAEIIAAIHRQRVWPQWQEGYIPNPATFINGKRWLDEEPPRKQTPNGRASPFAGIDEFEQRVNGTHEAEPEYVEATWRST